MKDGIYSVSSSYIAMLGTVTRLRKADLLWSSIMLPTQRVIMWLAYQDRLLTNARMQKLNIHMDTEECCLCAEDEAETVQRPFVDCQLVSEVRNAMSSWAGITIPRKAATRSLQWIKGRRWKQLKKEIVAAIRGVKVYYTWQARNWKYSDIYV
ncbi:hypothetical protein FXO37_31551 [Capsicum annuum]|nr:hypothetical protein FXO37_31551 [Capsicum annuum]